MIGEKSELTEESVEEYLARGGKITVCEPGVRTENVQIGQWTRNRRRVKAPEPDTEVELVPLTGNETAEPPGK